MRNPIIAQFLADLVSQEAAMLRHIECVRRDFPAFWERYTQGNPEYSFDKTVQELKESVELKDTTSIIERGTIFLSVLEELSGVILSLEEIVNTQPYDERKKASYRKSFIAMKNIILSLRYSVEEKILPQPIPA